MQHQQAAIESAADRGTGQMGLRTVTDDFFIRDSIGRAKPLNRTQIQKLCDLLTQVNGVTAITAKGLVDEFLPEGGSCAELVDAFK